MCQSAEPTAQPKCLATTATGGSLWLAGERPPVAGFADTAAVHRWLDGLLAAPHRSTTAWPLAHVLEHAAQSIDYSLDGYPQLRAPWFRASLGALAFAAFARRGRMSHGTTEAIPGAPALAIADLPSAVARLAQALERFEAAPPGRRLAPHFAYGELRRDDYRRAHLLHLADHAREIVPA